MKGYDKYYYMPAGILELRTQTRLEHGLLLKLDGAFGGVVFAGDKRFYRADTVPVWINRRNVQNLPTTEKGPERLGSVLGLPRDDEHTHQASE